MPKAIPVNWNNLYLFTIYMNDGKTQNADIIEKGLKLIDTYVTKKCEMCQVNCLLRGR